MKRPTKKGHSGRGVESLKVRVKTAKGRKLSSTRWLQRQLNDPYVQRAKADGFRGRAAYKIMDIDDKYHFLTQGARVVDLGAAPGGWAQVAVRRINSDGANPKKRVGKLIGLDLLPMDPLEGAEFLELDFLEEGADAVITAAIGGEADVVMSDMAPWTSGHKSTDHLRIMALVEASAELAMDILAPGGTFVAKVFEGGATAEIMAMLKPRFQKTLHMKPASSRKDSSEKFLVCLGFKGEIDEEDGKNEV